MRSIDMQTWPRRHHFALFSAFDHPHFSMCVNVDTTAFYPFGKRLRRPSQPRLRAHRSKLFGLTIDPVRLQQIRQERRPDSSYAKLETCKREVAAAEKLFRAERIPVLSTTHVSIEEISSKVMSTLGLQRVMY